MSESPGSGKAGARTCALVALGALAIAAFAPRAAAQTSPGPPELDANRRVYRIGLDSVPGEAKLAATLDELEAANPERRFFVVFASDARAGALARATFAAWTRAAADDAKLPFRADSSFVVVATARAPEVGVGAPPALRDRLGLSPFVLEKLAGTTFAAPALRGELASGTEGFVRALAAWLDEAQKQCEQDRVAVLESETKPPAPDVALGALSEVLAGLEVRATALGSRGADLSAAEPSLVAARADLRRAVLSLPERPELAITALRHAEGAIATARSSIDRLEGERTALRDRASHLEAELHRARAELDAALPAVARDLEHAGSFLTDARRNLDAKPHDALHALDEAEAALASARSAGVPSPLPAPTPTVEAQLPFTLRGLLFALLVLLPLAVAGVAIGLREARASARESFLVRRDQVERDARELRSALETLRDRRDQVARPPRVAIPLALGEEMGLVSPAESGPSPQPGSSASIAAAAPVTASSPPTPPAEPSPQPGPEATSAAAPVTASSSATAPAPTDSAPAPPVSSSKPDSGALRVSEAALKRTTDSGQLRVTDVRRSSPSGIRAVPGLDGTVSSGRVRVLEERFDLAPAQAFAGETAQLLARANGAIADLGAAWDSAEGALGDSETRVLRATFFGSFAFTDARELLDLVPNRVDLEPRVELARGLLETVGGVGERAREALSTMGRDLALAEKALDRAVASGLAPAAFEDELAQAQELAREAVFAAPSDPVRAAALADAVATQARKLDEGIERAEAVRVEIAQASESVARLGEKVAPRSARDDDDPGFLHERALASLAEAQSALELGVPEEARKELARAREHVAFAEEALGHKEDAKVQGAAPLDERRTEARDAREALARARAALSALEAEHARDSWEEVAPQLESAERTLPALEAELEVAASLVGSESGRFARTRVQLLRLDSHLTELRRAAAAVERRLAGLREDRGTLPKRAEEVEKRLRELQSFAKDEEVSLRVSTLARMDDARMAVDRIASKARACAADDPARSARPDLPSLIRELDALELELEEVRAQIARDGFLCRRALNARRAAEQAVRSSEDARRRGRDRLAARQREARAREIIDRTEPLLPRTDTDWIVVLDAYTCSIRASYGARELAGRREGAGSDVRHALREARRALRGAERFDAAFVEVDAEPAQVLLRRALEAAEAGDEAQAVENAERAAAAADEARRAALFRARALELANEQAIREAARAHRQARERLERKRLLAEAQRRAVWLGLRFGPAQARSLSFEESAAALKSVEV